MIDMMRELYADVGGCADCEDKIRQTWRVIQEASNLIRCYGALLDVDGRLYGLERKNTKFTMSNAELDSSDTVELSNYAVTTGKENALQTDLFNF